MFSNPKLIPQSKAKASASRRAERDRGTIAASVDLQLIRLRILHYLNWPIKTRQFVTCVAAVAHGRHGWFSYGHLFIADLLGLDGADDSKRKAVQRVLNQYEFDAIASDHDLFEFKRGGGKDRAITQY